MKALVSTGLTNHSDPRANRQHPASLLANRQARALLRPTGHLQADLGGRLIRNLRSL